MQNVEEGNLENILLEAGLISPQKVAQFKKIQRETGEKAEKILLSGEMINYREILSDIAKKMGVDFIDLEKIQVNKEALKKMEQEVAKKYSAFPFDMENNHLYVAMEKPDDIFLLDEMKIFTQMEIKPFLADSRLIAKAILCFYAEENSNLYAAAVAEPSLVDNCISAAESACMIQESNSNASDKGVPDMETALEAMLSESVNMDHVTGIHIDRLNRKITATVTVYY